MIKATVVDRNALIIGPKIAAKIDRNVDVIPFLGGDAAELINFSWSRYENPV